MASCGCPGQGQRVAGIRHRPDHGLHGGATQVALQIEHQRAMADTMEALQPGLRTPALGARTLHRVAGENTAMPSCPPPSAATMPPTTPLPAGMPARMVRSPPKSHMPPGVITLRMAPTCPGGQAAPSADGVHAAIGQCRGDQRQVPAVDDDGTLLEAQRQCGFRVFREDARVGQEVADGAVAMAGAEFGLEDIRVGAQLPAGVGRCRVQHALPENAGCGALHQRAGGAYALFSEALGPVRHIHRLGGL